MGDRGIDEMDAARIERLLAANVLGPFLCCGEAVRRLSTRHGGPGGSIVLMSSSASRTGSAGTYVDYAACNGALDTLGVGLAKEVAGEGIRVKHRAPRRHRHRHPRRQRAVPRSVIDVGGTRRSRQQL